MTFEPKKYHWQGVNFDSPPHQLEVNLSRGILYMHNCLTGVTSLRVCRIPRRELQEFLVPALGAPVIDLGLVIPGPPGGVTGLRGVERREIALLDLPEYTDGGGRFAIIGWNKLEDIYRGEVSKEFFVFTSVPVRVVTKLWMGEFTDITLGVTK